MLRLLTLLLMSPIFQLGIVHAEALNRQELEQTMNSIRIKNSVAMKKIGILTTNKTLNEHIEKERQTLSDIHLNSLPQQTVNFDVLVNKNATIQQSAISSELSNFIEKKELEQLKLREQGSLLIFVSLSLPSDVLKQYFNDAEKLGASIVFRGFKNNDYLTMRNAISALGITSGYQIDPVATKRYGISAVPAFVLTLDDEKPCAGKNCPVAPFMKAEGVISIRDFLQLSKGYGQVSERIVNSWLERL